MIDGRSAHGANFLRLGSMRKAYDVARTAAADEVGSAETDYRVCHSMDAIVAITKVAVRLTYTSETQG